MNRQISKNRGGPSDFIVRITGGEGINIQGKIEHIQSGRVHNFSDFLEMVLLMQQKMDELAYPQPDTELRTFRNRG